MKAHYFWLYFGLTLLVSACGGGGGGVNTDGTSDFPDSINETNSPDLETVADAGDDKAVSPGETVELDADGSEGPIISYSWLQIAGPRVTMANTDSGTAGKSFVAPDVRTRTVLEFRLKVLGIENSSDSDTVTVTVLPAPVASAGRDQAVGGTTEVILSAAVIPDEDGIEYTFSWQQTGGEPVALTNADQAEARFTAPNTLSAISLTFELTVTNEAGASDSDTVIVDVAHPDAPVLGLTFPPPAGAYLDSKISVFGTVAAVGGETVTSLTVDTGFGEEVVTPEADGSWRIDDVTVPDGVSEFTVTVKAEDSQDRDRLTRSRLLTDDNVVGKGQSWEESIAVVVDSGDETAYVLTTGFFVSDIRIIPVDLETGSRGESITDFSDESQGPTLNAFNDMVYDRGDGRFYLTQAGSRTGAAVISIERDSGQRIMVSDGGDVSQGDLLWVPVGLALGPTGSLYVADNGGSDGVPAVLEMAIGTGQRERVADGTTPAEGVGKPLHLAWNGNDKLWLSQNVSFYAPVLEFDLSAGSTTSSVLTSGDTEPALTPESQGVVVDTVGNRLFVMNGGDDNIIAVDLASGTRSLIAGDVTGSTSFSNSRRKGIAFDADNRLLYAVGGTGSASNDALFVIDPESGDKVILSR